MAVTLSKDTDNKLGGIDLNIFLTNDRVFIPDTSIPVNVCKGEFIKSLCLQLKELTGKDYIDLPVYVSEEELFEKGAYPSAIEGQYIQPYPSLFDKNGDYVFNHDIVYDTDGNSWHVQYYFDKGVKILLDPVNLCDNKLFITVRDLLSYSKVPVTDNEPALSDRGVPLLSNDCDENSDIDVVVDNKFEIVNKDDDKISIPAREDIYSLYEMDVKLNIHLDIFWIIFAANSGFVLSFLLKLSNAFMTSELFNEIFLSDSDFLNALDISFLIVKYLMLFIGVFSVFKLCLKIVYATVPSSRKSLSKFILSNKQ